MATMCVLKKEQTENRFKIESDNQYKFFNELKEIKTQIDNGANLKAELKKAKDVLQKHDRETISKQNIAARQLYDWLSAITCYSDELELLKRED